MASSIGTNTMQGMQERPEFENTPVLLRKIALRMRKTLLDAGCPEDVLVDLEKQILNFTNGEDIKAMFQQIKDKYGDE